MRAWFAGRPAQRSSGGMEHNEYCLSLIAVAYDIIIAAFAAWAELCAKDAIAAAGTLTIPDDWTRPRLREFLNDATRAFAAQRAQDDPRRARANNDRLDAQQEHLAAQTAPLRSPSGPAAAAAAAARAATSQSTPPAHRRVPKSPATPSSRKNRRSAPASPSSRAGLSKRKGSPQAAKPPSTPARKKPPAKRSRT